MKRSPIGILLAVALPVFTCCIAVGTAGAAGKNPLSAEMVALTEATQEAVTAIATGDGQQLTKALDVVRAARKQTQAALQAGTLTLPKNSDRLEDFTRRDEAELAALDALDRASRRNDLEAMLMITKQLLEGCVSCHRMFWK